MITIFIFILSTVDLYKSLTLFNSINILALKVLPMDSAFLCAYHELDHFYFLWI